MCQSGCLLIITRGCLLHHGCLRHGICCSLDEGAIWSAGGWWWNRDDMTVRELDRMKTRELNNGRLAMCAAHLPSFVAMYDF